MSHRFITVFLHGEGLYVRISIQRFILPNILLYPDKELEKGDREEQNTIQFGLVSIMIIFFFWKNQQ